MSTELRPAKNGQITAAARTSSTSSLLLLAGADGRVGRPVFSFWNGLASQGRNSWNTNTTAAAIATSDQLDSIVVRAPWRISCRPKTG